MSIDESSSSNPASARGCYCRQRLSQQPGREGDVLSVAPTFEGTALPFMIFLRPVVAEALQPLDRAALGPGHV
jgi:hypothetical protein